MPGRQNESGRSPFARDRDRVLYSSAFRTLAGKTQVVAATELGNFHNRLTHSLKVAQLGRVIATRLSVDGSPDPDLVETACLAHDIGHPPFGHAGEVALNARMDVLRDSAPKDGFEGNAQNLRILTFLANGSDDGRGLHLTRATLLAATKYPWLRNASPNPALAKKWGAYESEREALEWIRDGYGDQPLVPGPVEKQIMDWCDDVAYACHDMEDFYRQGFIPLDRLFRFEIPEGSQLANQEEPEELRRLLDYIQMKWTARGLPFDRHEAVARWRELKQFVFVEEPYLPSRAMKTLLKQTVSGLISYFADSVTLDPPDSCGYRGSLIVPPSQRLACDLLQELIWFYVIEKPQLAGQQHGQKRVISDLLDWHFEEPSLLPEDRHEELEEHQDALRAACDHVSSLSEAHALRLHRRLSGTDFGAFTDSV